MRAILLHVDHGPAFADRLDYALDLARHGGGHLTLVQAISLQAVEASDFGGVGTSTALQALEEAAAEQRAQLEARLAREDVPWDWDTAYGGELAALQRRASLSDVVVMGPRGWGSKNGDAGGGGAPLAGRLALAVQTPVLLVPQGWSAFDPQAPALVAWNGSREAGNALRAALPLLREASAVTLATVGEARKQGRDGLPDTDGARYLARHGVDCAIVPLERGEASVAEVISRAAALRECGLLVMGAYGHSRLAEVLFGGVTHSMLAAPPVPVLLAH